jgi:hypothetical protein
MRAVVDVSSQLDAKQRSQLITEWNEHMGS